MSADNWIYILHTRDDFKKEWNSCINMFDKKIDAYRVAHTQAIDNYDWYIKNEIHNLWAYLYSGWWDCEIFYSLEDAEYKARELEKEIWYTEYWISVIDATKYNFIDFSL
jgi:hypothetical protein